jgi:uncharacterized cupredoxin-like copper-binding protein
MRTAAAFSVAATVLALAAACSSGGGRAPTPGGATVTPQPSAVTEIAPPTPGAAATSRTPDATVAVTLASYSVAPDRSSVKAGVIRFIATNTASDSKHQFVVLKFGGDGSLSKAGEIAAMNPQSGGTITLELARGSYQLACLIKKGEDGSAIDHYQQGMRADFKVE